MSGNKNGPILYPALCRCCRAIKRCRILTAEYTWIEKKEIYADMIIDCFGIVLSPEDAGEMLCGVCATCVVRLRDACAFREQVLQSEQLFLKAKITSAMDTPPTETTELPSETEKEVTLEIELKNEPKEDVSEHFASRCASPDHSADEDATELPSETEKEVTLEIELKTEPKEDVSEHSASRCAFPDHTADEDATELPSETEKGLTLEIELKTEPKEDVSEHFASRCASPDHSADEDYEPPKEECHEETVTDLVAPAQPAERNDYDSASSSDPSYEPIKRRKRKSEKMNGAGKEKGSKAKKAKAGTSKKATITPKKPPTEKKNNSATDLDCMAKENLLKIIHYSYVCPFKNMRNNYYCFYCKQIFSKPEDLRDHTLTHDTKPFKKLIGYRKMPKGYRRKPKLDITRIDCKLCPMKIDDINVFKQHIDQVHEKKIYFEAPDKMLLFRLTRENLVCVLCSGVFKDFKTLDTHMEDIHFINFKCDFCEGCFLEEPS